jgi:hypothetical protein
MTLLGVSQAQMRASARSQNRVMSLVLAESGIRGDGALEERSGINPDLNPAVTAGG